MEEIVAVPIRATRHRDVELVVGARGGDRDAFDRLMVSRMEPTFRTAMAILGHEADARDATQDVFVKAWRDLPALRDVERFDAWFGRILVNTCRSALRGRRRRRVREIPVSSLPDIKDRPSVTSTEPLDGLAAATDLLELAFERLTVDERALLVLHHLDHRPLAEIAVALAIPEGTVKSRLHRARRTLEWAFQVERR